MEPSKAGTLFAGKEKLRLSELAAQVRKAEPRTLTPENTTDLITLIEFMQADIDERYAALVDLAERVEVRDADVTKREGEVAAAMRLLKLKPVVPREKQWWWR